MSTPLLTRNKVAGSVERIEVDITAAATLDGTTIEIALVEAEVAATWLPADWIATPTTSGTARTDDPVTLAEGTYVVRARITATPEFPVVDCYILAVHP